MSTPYDDSFKLFIDEYAQAIASWVCRGANVTQHVRTEFTTRKVVADALLEMQLANQKCLLHIEFQSSIKQNMPQRLLEYNFAARRKYMYPVYSCVIYINCKGNVPQPPLRWDFPDGRDVLTFDYTSINLAALTVEQLRATGIVELTPLWPLTSNGAQIEVVEHAIETLVQAEQRELLAFTELFASLVFKNAADHNWLTRRFIMLNNILRGTPAYQRIMKEGRQEGLQEGLQEGRQAGFIEGQRAAFYSVLQKRFPELVVWARQLLDTVNDQGLPLDLIVRSSDASTADEMRQLITDALAHQSQHQ